MGRTVELDKRGRLLLPAEIRNRIGSKRFLLREVEGGLELEPLPSPEGVKGKYQGLLDKDMEDLEKDQEEFVKRDRIGNRVGGCGESHQKRGKISRDDEKTGFRLTRV